MPFFTRCVPKGLVLYEEKKTEELAEAARDREESRIAGESIAKRLAIISHIHRAMPQIDVFGIAATVDPWDMELFKSRVADAQARFQADR